MTAEEFNNKYSINFTKAAYESTLVNIASHGVSITYTKDRMPTPSDRKVRLNGNNSQLAYLKHLQSGLETYAKFRPAFDKNGNIDQFIQDFESVFQGFGYVNREPFDGIPYNLINMMKKEAIAKIPENAENYEKNLIVHNAMARKESETGYAKTKMAAHIREGRNDKAIDTLKAMEKIHSSHGWKFGNIFKNIREVFAIRSMRNSLKQTFGSEEAFERAYAEESKSYGYKEAELDNLEKEAATQSPEAQKEAKSVDAEKDLSRESIVVKEVEEPVAEASEKAQETQPVAPQKGLQ